MAAHDPERRRLAAAEAIHRRWATAGPEQRRAATETARATRRRQLEDQVDPNRELDEVERDRRVRNLIRAELARISRLGVAARRARRREADNAALDELIASETSSSS